MLNIKVRRKPTTETNNMYGTIKYISLEIHIQKYVFEANVNSFAMVCFKILTKKEPFDGIKTKKKISQKTKNNKRPKLPPNQKRLT